MKTKKIKIDCINNFDLRSDLENGYIKDGILSAEDLISDDPKTWLITVSFRNSAPVDYFYESENEYLEDVKTLNL